MTISINVTGKTKLCDHIKKRSYHSFHLISSKLK